jgi:hypothetical protein
MDWVKGKGIAFAYGAEHGYLVSTSDREVRLARFLMSTGIAGLTAVTAREAMESVIVFPLGRGPGRPGGEPELRALTESAKVYAERFEAGESLPGFPAWQQPMPEAEARDAARSFEQRYPGRVGARRSGGTLPPSLEKVFTPPRRRGALAYRCPRCHAEPGEDCRTAGGLPTLTPHTSRQDLHNTKQRLIADQDAGQNQSST